MLRIALIIKQISLQYCCYAFSDFIFVIHLVVGSLVVGRVGALAPQLVYLHQRLRRKYFSNFEQNCVSAIQMQLEIIVLQSAVIKAYKKH